MTPRLDGRFHASTILFLALNLLPSSGLAQSRVELLPRSAFHLDAEHLTGEADIRYRWDANFGGDLDLLAWPGGRATFLANYEVVLGEERRRFDPNQGNYTLEGSVSERITDGVDVAAVFHHVSRHLADHVKIPAVDWNMFGGRVRHRLTRGRLSLDSRLEYRTVVERSIVDYAWEIEGGTAAYHAFRPRIGVVSNATVRYVGVNGSRGRGGQTALRGEGGVRLNGSGAAVELFLAAERRVDPYPLEASIARWWTAGFRLRSR